MVLFYRVLLFSTVGIIVGIILNYTLWYVCINYANLPLGQNQFFPIQMRNYFIYNYLEGDFSPLKANESGWNLVGIKIFK